MQTTDRRFAAGYRTIRDGYNSLANTVSGASAADFGIPANEAKHFESIKNRLMVVHEQLLVITDKMVALGMLQTEEEVTAALDDGREN